MISTFTEENFHQLCDALAKKDKHLKEIIKKHGYPPMWRRKPNFETLIHIILEQQVSLASAKAALNKLKEKIGTITPKKLLLLTDAEMKACYFSRQKIIYARHLAKSIVNGELSMDSLSTTDNSRKGMMNIGLRPTVDGKQRTIEVNIFDFDEDIYGKKLRVFVKKYLRGEQKFAGLDALKEQLAKDKVNAIEALNVKDK